MIGLLRLAFGLLAGLAGGWLPAAETRDLPPVDRVSGPPPGVVVFASPDREKFFCGSPSIIILPDGSYLVSHDIGGRHDRAGHTVLQASTDRGASWRQVGEVSNQKWSTLFQHRGAVYLIGTSARPGDMIIRRSTDGGRTWTDPVDGRHGLLAQGKYHCAPTPVVVHRGRIWRAFEQFAETAPVRAFGAFVMSAPEAADLLEASAWTRSNALTHQRDWLATRNGEWLEGNVVVTPQGGLVDILRVESHPAIGAPFALPGANARIPRFEVAAALPIAADGRTVSFDPTRDYLHFIGSEAKFTIRFDERSGRYWSIGSKITNPHTGYAWLYTPHHQRNVLSLTSSTDLRTWEERCRLLRFREGQVVTKEESRVGFQYVDWQFDGEDLIAVCRTSWNGLNYHDANFITFHRVRNFRTLTLSDSPPALGP
ncbi:MAG: exo-alpha-sialidase [Verrucomicrobia bacterium]|nr:exo-alpha-sialidase [Verrucomicrobiota bacterium]